MFSATLAYFSHTKLIHTFLFPISFKIFSLYYIFRVCLVKNIQVYLNFQYDRSVHVQLGVALDMISPRPVYHFTLAKAAKLTFLLKKLNLDLVFEGLIFPIDVEWGLFNVRGGRGGKQVTKGGHTRVLLLQR